MRQNHTIKTQRALLKEMHASEDDPRVKALDRIEAEQSFEHESRVSHTEQENE